MFHALRYLALSPGGTPHRGELRFEQMKAGTIALLVVVATALLAGGGALMVGLMSLRTELSNVRKDLAATKERLLRFEGREDQARPRQSELDRARGSQSTQAPQQSGLLTFELSHEEVQLVKNYIKVPPVPSGAAPAIALGTSIPPAALLPLPSQVSERAPRLEGARFVIDPAGAIIIVRRGSLRADAIIPPN